jgi:hypothetical protein
VLSHKSEEISPHLATSKTVCPNIMCVKEIREQIIRSTLLWISVSESLLLFHSLGCRWLANWTSRKRYTKNFRWRWRQFPTKIKKTRPPACANRTSSCDKPTSYSKTAESLARKILPQRSQFFFSSFRAVIERIEYFFAAWFLSARQSCYQLFFFYCFFFEWAQVVLTSLVLQNKYTKLWTLVVISWSVMDLQGWFCC